MRNTLSSEQADQLDTTEEIQTNFTSAEFSDSEKHEIHVEYFIHMTLKSGFLVTIKTYKAKSCWSQKTID